MTQSKARLNPVVEWPPLSYKVTPTISVPFALEYKVDDMFLSNRVLCLALNPGDSTYWSSVSPSLRANKRAKIAFGSPNSRFS